MLIYFYFIIKLYNNGDVYVGGHFMGKMQGKGQYEWASGGIYIGDFK